MSGAKLVELNFAKCPSSDQTGLSVMFQSLAVDCGQQTYTFRTQEFKSVRTSWSQSCCRCFCINCPCHFPTFTSWDFRECYPQTLRFSRLQAATKNGVVFWQGSEIRIHRKILEVSWKRVLFCIVADLCDSMLFDRHLRTLFFLLFFGIPSQGTFVWFTLVVTKFHVCRFACIVKNLTCLFYP